MPREEAGQLADLVREEAERLVSCQLPAIMVLISTYEDDQHHHHYQNISRYGARGGGEIG